MTRHDVITRALGTKFQFVIKILIADTQFFFRALSFAQLTYIYNSYREDGFVSLGKFGFSFIIN